VVVVVGGLVVVLDGVVVAVVAEVPDALDVEAGGAAVTATVPAINATGEEIKVMGRRTLRARGGRRAGRRRACRAVEVPNRLIAPLRRRACRAVEVPNRLIFPPRHGNHARYVSFIPRASRATGNQRRFSTKSDSILQRNEGAMILLREGCNTAWANPRIGVRTHDSQP
jgi:hypothetical protein